MKMYKYEKTGLNNPLMTFCLLHICLFSYCQIEYPVSPDRTFYTYTLEVWFVVFYGISTYVSYLIPNLYIHVAELAAAAKYTDCISASE